MAVSADRRVAIGDGEFAYEIRVYGPDDSETARVRLDLPRPRKTDEMIASEQAQLAEKMGLAPREAGKEVQMPEVDPTRRHFGFHGLRFDGEGRLWVLTWHGEPGKTRFDVFSPDLESLGPVTVSGEVTRFDILGDRLALCRIGEVGYPEVVLYSIR
jgi:hypothetical protein